MEIEEGVVVVGAGIAGLATALALKRIGVRSLVLERSHQLRTTGTAITLAPNAWVALDALGVSNKLTSSYTPFSKGLITNVKNGNVQEVIYGGKDSGVRTVHRRALLEALAHELPVDAIRFSSKLRFIETVKHEGSTIAVLRLDDETIIKAKVVIGCDGVNSVVGRWLGLKPPIHSGRFSVLGLSVFPQGHGLKHEVRQFVDGDSRTGFVPLNDKEVYWFGTFKSTSSRDDMVTKDPESIQKSVIEELAHFPPIFLDVIQHSDISSLSWQPLMFRVPWDLLLSDMSKDNITVAGDAMHPMTSDLGQGGCSSLEDAVVLGRHIGNCLIENGKIDSRALEGFIKERRWRAAMLISGSYLSGWIQQGGTAWLKEFLRDKVFYKFFLRLVTNITQYNCGKLPNAFSTTEGNASKKSD